MYAFNDLHVRMSFAGMQLTSLPNEVVFRASLSFENTIQD
jgi:hypothetical protein